MATQPRKILILGAGGHGQVVADIFLQSKKAGASIEILGFLDDNSKLHGKKILGIPILGSIQAISKISHDAVLLAVGDNKTRRILFEQLSASGETFISACHPSAVIASEVKWGPGSMIGAGVILNPGTTVGASVILNTGAIIEHHNTIGDHTHIAPGVVLGGEVQIGNGTLIGLGAKVMRGCKIGKGCVIGAGAVVLEDIEDDQTVFGIPAKVAAKEIS